MRLSVRLWRALRGEIIELEADKPRRKKSQVTPMEPVALSEMSLAERFDRARGAAKAARSKKLIKFIEIVPRFDLADGTPIPADVIKGWLALAIAAEDPTGNAEADANLDLMAPRDAARFSQWVLETWIAFDTAKKSLKQAEQKALSDVQRQRSWGVFGRNPPADLRDTPEFAKARNKHLRRYSNSGFSSRGVLALAVRTPSDAAVQICSDFMEKHVSRVSFRAPSGQAVMEFLRKSYSRDSVPVLSIAKGLQRRSTIAPLAAEMLEEIRTEHGWTLEELGDRTAPTAGLDERCGIDLPWGEVVYRAELGDDLEVTLLNPAGQPVKGLPAAGDSDRKVSKKRLSELKKTVSATVRAQTTRLYDEMCMGRVWRLEDWERFILHHPIVGRLAQRLIWIAETPDGPRSFRPLAEGDATDAGDDPVDLTEATGIALAHRLTLGEEATKAWRAHLADYEIVPLFGQLKRPVIRRDDLLPAESAGTDVLPNDLLAIEKSERWAPDLLAAARRVGFEPAESMTYSFPSLTKSVGPVRFTLDVMGYAAREQGEVYVRDFSVTGVEGDLPPILLSEIANDMREMLGGNPFASPNRL